MNTKEILSRFEETAEVYMRDLEGLSMEQLTWKPQDDQWSLGQMYMHLIQSALYMQLRNVETCRNAEIEANTENGKSEAGEAVFALGSFPPVAIQVPPSPEYTPLQPESKEQIRSGLKAVIAKMRELEPLLAEHTGQGTFAHPRLGSLNAHEWYQLVEMHYRHHFLQKTRLENFLAVQK